MVLVIIGDNASGKTTVSTYLKEKYGFEVVDIGDFVRRNYNLYAKSGQSLAEYAQWAVETDYIKSITYEAINSVDMNRNSNLIFSGVRTLQGLLLIIERVQKLKIIKIECSLANRKKRYFKAKNDHINFEDRNNQESKWMESIYNSIHIDFTIDNNFNEEQLMESIDEVYDKLKSIDRG